MRHTINRKRTRCGSLRDLKLARHSANLSRRKGVLKCSNLLTSTWSRVRSEFKHVFEIKDILRVALAAASLSRQIGYERKCVFFLHDAANLLLDESKKIEIFETIIHAA